jgi:hypothetical protein
VNLEELRINSSDLRQHEPLKNFLTQCKSLIILELNAIDCDLMSFFTSANFSFQLKELSLSSTLIKKAETYDNEDMAINFFNTLCSSLTTLEIHAPLPNKVLDFLLKKFRLLKRLTLKTNLIPLEMNFYPQKHPKRSVKVLTLEGPYMNVRQTEGILRLYPVVQALNLDNIYPDIASETVAQILKLVSAFCSALHELTIPRLPWLT